MWRRYRPTTNRSSLARDLQQPLAAGRKAHGHRGCGAGAFGQDTHEADDVRSHGLVREMIVRDQPDNLPALTDHDLGIKGKPAHQFGAELRPRDRLPDHEGARCTDADGIQVLQLFGERGRAEGPVTTDVESSQKNHECHESPPAGAARNLIHRSSAVTGMSGSYGRPPTTGRPERRPLPVSPERTPAAGPVREQPRPSSGPTALSWARRLRGGRGAPFAATHRGRKNVASGLDVKKVRRAELFAHEHARDRVPGHQARFAAARFSVPVRSVELVTGQ